jgi:hypothetical protein
MNNVRNPFRLIFNRIFLATILTLLVPLWGSSAIAGYTHVGVATGFSYGSSDVEFLSAYGSWDNVAPYGQVWVPSVASDWRPFSYGNWIWTDDGWSWTSYEPYGWLVYHYGHWDFQPGMGWFWIPNNTWSPATVDWTTFGDYVCWAPAPPFGVYWPQPWEPGPFGFNVWIGVTLGDFDRENVGGFRVREFPGRDEITREHIFNGPPDMVLVERQTNHSFTPQRIVRRPVNWPNREYERVIPSHLQQSIIQRWQPGLEGTVYMPRNVSPEQRNQNEHNGQGENRGTPQGDHGQRRNSGSGGESRGGDHSGGHGGGGRGGGERGR